MEGDYPYADSDVLIYDPKWNNYFEYSDVFLTKNGQPVLNLDSITMKKSPSTSTHDYVLLNHELDPTIQNHGTSIDADNNNNDNVPPEQYLNNCMGQIELWTKRAMKVHKERECALEQSVRGQDHEIKQRDEVIERLKKELKLEKARRSQQVSRLKRELNETKKLLEDHRKELKDVNFKFEAYKAHVHPHLIHSDYAWRHGGPMLNMNMNNNIGHGRN